MARILSTRIAICILFATSSMIISPSQTAHAQNTEAHKTPPAFTENEPTSSLEVLKVESTRWKITEEEYTRYLELAQGPRGSFSAPNITPIEVLGIHAETAAKRQKYATLWVEMIKADTADVLAFQNTVNAVWTARYPDEPIINRERINQLRAASNSRFGPLETKVKQRPMSFAGRTLFFTRTRCDKCDRHLDALLGLLEGGKIAGLDIYLAGIPHDDDKAIQAWAREREVPIENLGKRTITLNHDTGVSAAVAARIGQQPSTPMTVQRHGEHYELLAVSDQ